MAKSAKPGAATQRKSTSTPHGCQIGELLHLLGEQYVLDILHLFISNPKPRRFVDLQRELRLSPNTLTDRLQGLVAAGLLTRTAYNEIPPRVEYAPTPKTIEFQDVFRQLSAWADRHTLQPEPPAVAN